MSLPRDAHLLPVGTELGGGIRVGYGQVLTKTVVRLPADSPLPRNPPRPTRRRMVAERSKSKLEVAMEGDDAELAEFLIANPHYSDQTWASRAGRKTRRAGEKREAFIRRVLMGEGS